MSKYQDWIEELKKNKRSDPQLVGLLEAYFIGKNDAVLKSIVAIRGWQWSSLYNPRDIFVPSTEEYAEDDRRAIKLDLARNPQSSYSTPIQLAITQNPEADYLAPFLKALEEDWSLSEIIEWIDRELLPYFGPRMLKDDAYEERTAETSTIRFLLDRSKKEIAQAVKMVHHLPEERPYWREGDLDHLPWVYFKFDRPRLRELADLWLGKEADLSAFSAIAFARSEDPELEERVAGRLEDFAPGEKLQVAKALHEMDSGKYEERLWNAACACLDDSDYAHMGVTKTLIQHFGTRALEPMIEKIENLAGSGWYFVNRLTQVREMLDEKGAPFFLATFSVEDDYYAHLSALGHLIDFENDAYEVEIEKQLHSLIACSEYDFGVKAIGLAAKWHPERFEDDLWKALSHRSKGVREAAARGLSALGEPALEKAAETLVAKKAATRDASVSLLALIDSPRAGEMLEARLDEEPAEDVRDHILLALEKVWEEQGKELGLDYVEERIAKFIEKGGADPPAWLPLSKLPPLQFQNGEPVSEDALRYLIYRQSRAKEIVPDIEIKPLLAQIDRSTSGDFAAALLKAYLTSPQDAKERWALTLAGLLGDNRTIPLFLKAIREWPAISRHKLAEYAAQALALVGTDAALMAVDSLTIKFRSKYKNIGKAAAKSFRQSAFEQGITPEELGDRVVPRLGFEEGETSRVLEGGNRKIRMSIGPNLKFAFLDLDKNKPVKTVPTAIPAEVRAQVKEDAATLREVVKAQNLRLENLLVQQYEWPVDRWQALFLHHPVLQPYGSSLLWNCGDLVFRALEDATLTDAEDETVELPKSAQVKMIHPLNLSNDQRQAWVEHIADYEVAPPFLQLERPVLIPDEKTKDEKLFTAVDQTELGALTFRGRAERLGWVRGSVCDAGGITAYYKPFPGAGVDAFVWTDEMWVGMGVDDQMKMGKAFFVKHDSVEIGSYIYDEPENDKDERLFAFGEVPPLVYSEVISELGRIAGKDLNSPENDPSDS